MAQTTPCFVSNSVFIACAFLRVTHSFCTPFQFSYNLFFFVRSWKITKFACTFVVFSLFFSNKMKNYSCFHREWCDLQHLLTVWKIRFQGSLSHNNDISKMRQFRETNANGEELQNENSFVSHRTLLGYFESLTSFFLQSYSHIRTYSISFFYSCIWLFLKNKTFSEETREIIQFLVGVKDVCACVCLCA